MSTNDFHLPLLPGLRFDLSPGRNYFGKKQHFSVIGNICKTNDNFKVTRNPHNLYCTGQVPDLPFWLLFDKQILTFYGNFQNSVSSSIGNLNVRPIKIMYYLEDGTMKIIEPKTNNSGLYQGTMVGRQRIQRPDSQESFYDVTDLNIGNELEIYGKKILIMDCDEFTKQFLYRMGVKVPESLKYCSVDEKFKTNKIRATSKNSKKSLQFLKNDNMILRFIGFWDDQSSEYGIIHHLELLYYLADDTIEIRELFPPNVKEYGSVFLRRSPLPKTIHHPVIGYDSDSIETYKSSDLGIGIPINVYGRLITLADCDLFTKEYYRSKYGIENMDAIPLPELAPISKTSPKINVRELPPWNGHGSHADSAGNCNTIEPKPPQCDFSKFLYKDRIGSNSHILRFKSRLISDISDYDMRRFIISYYLKDDTLSVFETELRNSGYHSGMFFKRDVVLMPNQNMFTTNLPVHYSINDMWVGNILIINNYRFLLVGSDEYTLNYMEKHSNEFPKSNVHLIINKIREKLISTENGFKNFVAKNLQYLHSIKKKLMPVQFLEKAIKEVAGDIIEEQEFITVSRHFEVKNTMNKNNLENIRSHINTYLSRNLWQNNYQLQKHFEYLVEKTKNGFTNKEVKYILKANKLPLPDKLLDEMLDIIQPNDEGLFNYETIMDFLNYQLKPAQVIIPHPAKSTKSIQKFSPSEKNVLADNFIDWDSLINALDLQHTLNEKP